MCWSPQCGRSISCSTHRVSALYTPHFHLVRLAKIALTILRLLHFCALRASRGKACGAQPRRSLPDRKFTCQNHLHFRLENVISIPSGSLFAARWRPWKAIRFLNFSRRRTASLSRIRPNFPSFYVLEQEASHMYVRKKKLS